MGEACEKSTYHPVLDTAAPSFINLSLKTVRKQPSPQARPHGDICNCIPNRCCSRRSRAPQSGTADVAAGRHYGGGWGSCSCVSKGDCSRRSRPALRWGLGHLQLRLQGGLQPSRQAGAGAGGWGTCTCFRLGDCSHHSRPALRCGAGVAAAVSQSGTAAGRHARRHCRRLPHALRFQKKKYSHRPWLDRHVFSVIN